MQINFAKHNKKPAIEVEAEEIRLKGYSGFKFFIFKHATLKKWFVCEYFTGLIVASDNYKDECRKKARNKLNLETGKDKAKLQAVIGSKKFINGLSS